MRSSDRDTVVIVLLCFAAGLAIAHITDLDFERSSMSEVQDVSVDSNLLSLHTGCHLLEISVSSEQSDSIRMGLEGEEFHRPLTHDLALDLVEGSGESIDRVEIDNIVNGSYTSDIILSGGERVDSRPSDAVALAVRTDARISVDRHVLNENAEFLCDYHA